MRTGSILHVLLTSALALSTSIAWSADAPAPAPATGIRFRLTDDPATLDWNLAHTSHENYIIMNIMEGLIEEGADLKPKAALAESWEISPDGRTYTFHLRP